MKKSPKKQGKQAVDWAFTFNNHLEHPEACSIFENWVWKQRKYVYQEEVGESGTIHLQGQITLNKRMRLTELKGKW